MEAPGRLSFTVFLLALVFAGSECFQWTDSLQDSAFVAACVHGNVTLPWTFALSSGETVEDIKWNFRSQHGQQELIATYISGMFFASPSFSQRVHYIASGGLLLNHMTKFDSGNYSVDVAVHESSGAFHNYRKTAFVEVADGLRVREEADPVYDPETDSWHVSLSCGTVVNTDGSTHHIVWQTPTGVLPSTRYEDGHFYLHLENPVMGGNYSCGLVSNATASVCLPSHSQQQPTVVVDESKLRVSLLEAENRQLRTKFSLLESLVEDFVNTTKRLQDTSTRAVSFHARFAGNDKTSCSSGEAIAMSRVLTNQGGAYDASSGSFFAPFNGTYFFAAAAGSSPGTYADFFLMMDNTDICLTLNTDDRYNDGSSCAATVQLRHGQRVWLKCDSSYRFRGDTSVFTGFMINMGD